MKYSEAKKKLLRASATRVATYLRSNDELQNISPFQQIAAGAANSLVVRISPALRAGTGSPQLLTWCTFTIRFW